MEKKTRKASALRKSLEVRSPDRKRKNNREGTQRRRKVHEGQRKKDIKKQAGRHTEKKWTREVRSRMKGIKGHREE